MYKSYIAENIDREYRTKKRYEANKRRSRIELFKRIHCKDCKNKNTNLCNITINIRGELQCVYKE